ncbi:MAG: hypothetical protein U1F25_15605 [Rubrivivax sp.]
MARLRVPPHSVEGEQSVLGGLLLDNLAWDAPPLAESDFTASSTASSTAPSLRWCRRASRPTSSPHERLQALGKAEDCGGLAVFLNALAQSVPVLPTCGVMPKIVRERHPAQADRRQRRHCHHRVQPAGPRRAAGARRGRGQDPQDRRGGRAHARGLPEHRQARHSR